MNPSKESVKELKEILEKEYGKEISNEEAYEVVCNLIGFAEILYECSIKEAKRQRQLKGKPEGFHLTDGIYNCIICHRSIEGEETWYDKLSTKCLICQKAIKEKIVPAFVCKNRNSWYAMWELENKLEIKHQTAKKMIKEEKLNARIILNENGEPYEYVFLKKENPDLVDLDRKSLVKEKKEI